jgi:hypothetical protein
MQVIDINQDIAFVAGERIRNDNETTGGQLWARPLANGDICVILYNSGQHNDVRVSVSWEEIGWAKSDKVYVRDLWLHADIGLVAEGFESVLAAHDVTMLRLARDLSRYDTDFLQSLNQLN